MKRYKLEIPETIPKRWMLYSCLMKLDGQEVERVESSGKDAAIMLDGLSVGVPESWLIPIEDKPITAEEWDLIIDVRENLMHENANISNKIRRITRDSFKAGEKNQWINHEKLRMEADGYLLIVNALEYSLRDVPLSVDEVFKRTKHAFEEALKNIKPLT